MRIPNRVRYFNKRFLNRITGKVARSAWGPFSIICHVGRHSGKPYETPIIALPHGDQFIIALTYGPKVDWYQNVKAAGHCQILWHAQLYTIDKIMSLDRKTALPFFPWFERIILQIMGFQDFVSMKYRAN